MENKEFKGNENYGSDSIKILEGLEAVRKRPGMYIGSTGVKGLHHMIWEIVDNSIDEAMAGYATKVTVTIRKNGRIRVEDDGRGIPTDIHPKTGISTVETVLTVLHAGGKFDNDSYKVSGGLHGVGASVVNALSSVMDVWVNRNSKLHYARFENGGQIAQKLSVIGTSDKGNGTVVEFLPDFSIMEKQEWDIEVIQSRLKQLAYLNKGIQIELIDERPFEKVSQAWKFDGGIIQYVEDLNRDKEALIPSVCYTEKQEKVKSGSGEATYSVRVECALQWNKTYTPSVYSFCNNISTIEGGTHEEGFRLAITRILNRILVDKKYLKKEDDPLTQDDVREGLTAIISIKHPNPQYEGQTKGKLGNTEVRKLVSEVVGDGLERFLQENPDFAIEIMKKAMLAKEARIKSQEAREATRRKSPFESGGLPGKLADCSSRDPQVCELYLVEGDSAGGSAKLGRDREFQAILPLRGKVINVEKAKTDKIFANNEILSMVTAIGAGVGPEFDINKLRYHKITIMTDADVDGSHIRILLLTFFFRYMRPLVEAGNVYIAQPPLYKFAHGKSIQYCYSDEELEVLKKQYRENTKYTIQRYKGLGEMNPEQLWETTMDPQNRFLWQVKIEDALTADQSFSLLMGEDVAPRKTFIEENVKYVKNIDA
jgi:DNA gyrase subunit B